MAPPWSGKRGLLVGGRYRLVAPLGKGAMGEVWQAEHASLAAPVAIKLIDPDLLDRVIGADLREVLARFQREAQAAAALRSPHVVQILDHGVEGELAYMAMELLEGESLAHRLKQIGVLPPVQTARIVTHIARAITKAHDAGIVHRDLKPENVFLVKNDDHEVAKVLDFGIAKLTRSTLDIASLATQTGNIVGTPCYMSPEQAQGTQAIDGRTDLWALAVIAFECVCGRRPFQSEAVGDLILQICARPIPVPSQVAAVPPGFDAWWAKAAARDPEQRFQSAKAMAEALRTVLCPELVETTNPRLYAGGRTTDATQPALVQTKASRRQSVLLLCAIWIGALLALVLSGGLGPDPRRATASTRLPASEPPAPAASASGASPAESAAPSATAPSATAPVASSAAAPGSASAPTTRPRTDSGRAVPGRPAKTKVDRLGF